MNALKYFQIDEFEISTHRPYISERKNVHINESFSDRTGKCEYTYNSLGFRGDEPTKKGFKVMSIGCSLTEGVGVNDNETWPAQFCKLIPNSVNMNFGTAGRSNDFICRCLLSYYDLINPDLVLIMYTFPHRKEIYTKDGGIEDYTPTIKWGYTKETKDGIFLHETLSSIQNDNEDFINWYKNHMLIKYFLESKNCNWIWNGSFLSTNYFEENRYDGNFRSFLDKAVDNGHPGPITNKTYSINLYNHIYNNFKKYIPDNCGFISKSLI